MSKGKKAVKTIICILLAAVIAAGAEFLLSNYRYFGYSEYDDSPVELDEVLDEYFQLKSPYGIIQYDEDTSVKLNAGQTIRCLEFSVSSLECEEDKLCEIRINAVSPDNEEFSFTIVNDFIGIGKKVRTYRYFTEQAVEAKSIEINVPKPNGVVCISGITVNPQFRFGFNFWRALIVFAAVLACALVFAFKLYNIIYLPEKRSHRIFRLCTCAFCMGITLIACIFVLNTSTEKTEYPLKKSVESCNPYIQQFDAFMKGQLHLDAEPPAQLAELENPYDKEQRAGIFYLWDRAYYEGRYYSYFGTGPILTGYLPYYLIRHELPSYRFITSFYTLLFTLFFTLALFKWAEVFRKKIPCVLLFAITLSALFSSFIFLEMRGIEAFYYLALLSSGAFTAAFAYFMMCAFKSERRIARRVLMAVCGLMFGLAFLCRVNTVIVPAFVTAGVLAVYIFKSFRKKEKFLYVAADLVCLGAPVVLCMAAAFVFNYLRFGSPFDFGTDYQLTVSDTSLNTLFGGGVAAGIFYYFFEPFKLKETFPFLAVGRGGEFPVEDRFVYLDDNVGLFSIPHNIALALLPAYPLGKKKSGYEVVSVISGTAGLFVCAFVDFCLGGVIFRYTGDISFAGAFIAAVILFEIMHSMESYENRLTKVLKPVAAGLIILGCCASVIVASLEALTVDGNLSAFRPDVFEAIKRIFCFWL